MTLTQLLLLQLLAHLLTDFTFQSAKNAKDKNEKGFKSSYLKWHVLVMFVTSWVLSFQIKFIFAALFIALTHWLIDGFKPMVAKSKWVGKYAFFIDQALHLLFLGVTVLVFAKWVPLEPIVGIEIPEAWLAILIAFVFCGKTTNILIKEIFLVFDLKLTNGVAAENPERMEDLPNAGRVIGLTERWLVLVFVFINQFSAIGFLLAAKSILRYRSEQEEGFNKTEYVLIGTLLSFAFAIGAAIFVKLLFHPGGIGN
ncbi:DUF3307 domain-containing protein [Allomuricauda sp. d1]|uniref:DUF3307 domain-containing protein n=1 Tax=Allomuricauda sp. d1 TaxID=3136725 RepID=UPI0031E15C69